MYMYRAEDFRRVFENRKHDIQGVKGHFSVVVPIVDIKGEAHILYELRSSYIERQPGEVCFPGGEIEPGETREEAALRETFEEIGLAEKDIHIIAQLDTYHPPSSIVIYPFLAEVKEEALSHIRLSQTEVAEVFTVPVSFFDSQPYRYVHSYTPALEDDFDYSKIGLSVRRYDWRPMKNEVISWEWEGKYIWGITGHITAHTLRILKGEEQ